MGVVGDTVWWVKRAREVVPPEDRAVLLNPPALVKRFAHFAWMHHRHADVHEPGDDVDKRDPTFCLLLMDLYRILGEHYFRVRIEDVDNLPAEGPVLLVGNHNGAFVPSDGFFTALAILDRYGAERPFYSLAHDFLFEDPVLRTYAQKLGLLRATHESARRAFARGGCVLVYPGSDLETFRSFRERKKIVLGGRKGFLKLALESGVPIVPVVSAGTHEQLVILTRGDWLAKLLHAHAWARTDVMPIVLSLPWGITSGFMPYLPLPAQTTIAFGEPIRWPDLGPEDAQDPDVLERCYREVESRMQAILDRLDDGRRFLLGRPVDRRPVNGAGTALAR